MSSWQPGKARYVPVVPNSFGLPSGTSCPGQTLACKACYAANLERAYTNVSRLLASNLDQLRSCGDDVDAMAALLVDLLAEYVNACERYETKTGKTIARVFRIHWDGDFYSVAYARAWRRAILAYPGIKFWCYTRSFVPGANVVHVLKGLPNLTLYLSVDEYNEKRASAVHARHPWTRLAVLATTFDEASAVHVAITGKRAPRCPEVAQRVPMVNSEGIGACVTCGLCISGRQSVLFATSKR